MNRIEIREELLSLTLPAEHMSIRPATTSSFAGFELSVPIVAYVVDCKRQKDLVETCKSNGILTIGHEGSGSVFSVNDLSTDLNGITSLTSKNSKIACTHSVQYANMVLSHGRSHSIVLGYVGSDKLSFESLGIAFDPFDAAKKLSVCSDADFCVSIDGNVSSLLHALVSGASAGLVTVDESTTFDSFNRYVKDSYVAIGKLCALSQSVSVYDLQYKCRIVK